MMARMPACRAFLALALTLAIASGCRSSSTNSVARSFSGCQIVQGGIIRGPVDQRRIALVFTAHTFAEGADEILDALAQHHAHGSFFLTGAFLANASFAPLVGRMNSDGHYLGPHSDVHLLYCDWTAARKTLVTRGAFDADLLANVAKLPSPFSHSSSHPRFFLPAYEQYNSEIASWSAAEGFTLINFTPGTRSNADYTGEHDENFVSSQAIYDSILRRESDDPHGLNGFILLFHLGVGDGRRDKFADKFGTLLDALAAKGYQFVRIDELLAQDVK